MAKELLAKLQDKLSVLQWRQRQPTRAAVEWTIKEVLNELPQEPYPEDVWEAKVSATWRFFLDHGDSAWAGSFH